MSPPHLTRRDTLDESFRTAKVLRTEGRELRAQALALQDTAVRLRADARTLCRQAQHARGSAKRLQRKMGPDASDPNDGARYE